MTVKKRTWKTKDGKNMYSWGIDVKFRHPDGRVTRVRRASPVNTKRGAQRYEHEVRAALLEGTFRKEENVKEDERRVPVLREFAEQFISSYAVVNNKPSSVQSKRTILRHHLVPFFGQTRLDRIDARQIERYKALKLETLSRKTINNHLTVLRKLLVVACEWNLLDSIPNVKWVKAPKPEFRFLDFKETAQLLAAATCEPMWHTMILVAVRTGLRLGELLALRWRDVDLNARRLVVRRAVAAGVVGTPKSGRQRELPLTESVVLALRAYRHQRGELVFCQVDGAILTKGMCKWPLRRAKKRAGLAELGWHDLRHTFASHLVMRGVPLKAVQELMGHATIEMTMRYAHLAPRVLRAAVDVLDAPEEGHKRGTPSGPDKENDS